MHQADRRSEEGALSGIISQCPLNDFIFIITGQQVCGGHHATARGPIPIPVCRFAESIRGLRYSDCGK